MTNQLIVRMTAAHAQLQNELQSRATDLEAHQKGINEAREAHTKANEALAEVRAAREADESVLEHVKGELSQKERLLDQAMADLQATSQIEEKLRGREEEIEQVRAQHQEQLATAQEKHDGLLLEAAQMSDNKIAELSEQLQHAQSLRNEAVAELEHERAESAGSREREEELKVKGAEVTSKMKELQDVCDSY